MMAMYRIYLKDIDEHIVSHANTDCATDFEACIIAESLVEPGGQAEIWIGLRRVQVIGLSTISDRYRFIN